MGRRRNKRMNFALPVKLWVVDAEGNQRTESACTLDISSNGLRVFSRALAKPRQEVVIGYLNRRARYRVVWVGENGTPGEGIAGLTCLEPEKALFHDVLPEGGLYVDTHVPEITTNREPQPQPTAAAGGGEKRAATHYACEASADVRLVGDRPSRMWVSITDVSLDGCYLATQSPLDVNTPIQLRMFFAGVEVQALGKVKSRDPGIGMAVGFDSIGAEQFERLSQVIANLAERHTTISAAKPPAASARKEHAEGIDSQVLVRWFERNEVLTRTQYQELRQNGLLVNAGVLIGSA